MAEFTKTYDANIDLTVFTVIGEATFDEIWKLTNDFLCGEPSKLVLWDFTGGTIAHLSCQETEEIAKHGGAISSRIKGGKAALLAPNDIDYGMTRVFEVYSDFENFPLEIQGFRDMKAARNWLVSDQ